MLRNTKAGSDACQRDTSRYRRKENWKGGLEQRYYRSVMSLTGVTEQKVE